MGPQGRSEHLQVGDPLGQHRARGVARGRELAGQRDVGRGRARRGRGPAGRGGRRGGGSQGGLLHRLAGRVARDRPVRRGRRRGRVEPHRGGDVEGVGLLGPARRGDPLLAVPLSQGPGEHVDLAPEHPHVAVLGLHRQVVDVLEVGDLREPTPAHGEHEVGREQQREHAQAAGDHPGGELGGEGQGHDRGIGPAGAGLEGRVSRGGSRGAGLEGPGVSAPAGGTPRGATRRPSRPLRPAARARRGGSPGRRRTPGRAVGSRSRWSRRPRRPRARPGRGRR